MPERRALPPQAPTSQLVAQRILSHATAVPIKRFDSADFFLEQHKQKLQHRPYADAPHKEASSEPHALPPMDLCLEAPPLPLHLSPARGSPPLQCAAPCGSPLLRRS